MPTPREYRFDERLLFSQGASKGAEIEQILLDNIPGAIRAWPANCRDDRDGTDYWVKTPARDLSVDVKAREVDWAPRGFDDLALETWSVVERRVPGWSRNPAKRTDFVLWHWQDTGRWCLVPFPMLCKVFGEFCPAWASPASGYQLDRQFTPTRYGGYHSECVFVPRQTVWDAILARFGGALVPQPPRRVWHDKFGRGVVLATFKKLLRVQFGPDVRWLCELFCSEVGP